MPIYQNSTVSDAKIEAGNYIISVAVTAGTTVGGAWINLGAGMVSNFTYVPEMINTQAGNAPDPLEGVSRETATLDIELIEYDGSSFSILSGGLMTGTTGSAIVGGQTSVVTPRGIKLVGTRKLASGSTKTVTYVINSVTLPNGWGTTFKSDNDSDPITVYSFSLLAKQWATAGTIYTKTVA